MEVSRVVARQRPASNACASELEDAEAGAAAGSLRTESLTAESRNRPACIPVRAKSEPCAVTAHGDR